LREERRLSVFEYRVLRGIFGVKVEEGTGEGKNKTIMRLLICTAHQILCG